MDYAGMQYIYSWRWLLRPSQIMSKNCPNALPSGQIENMSILSRNGRIHQNEGTYLTQEECWQVSWMLCWQPWLTHWDGSGLCICTGMWHRYSCLALLIKAFQWLQYCVHTNGNLHHPVSCCSAEVQHTCMPDCWIPSSLPVRQTFLVCFFWSSASSSHLCWAVWVIHCCLAHLICLTWIDNEYIVMPTTGARLLLLEFVVSCQVILNVLALLLTNNHLATYLLCANFLCF